MQNSDELDIVFGLAIDMEVGDSGHMVDSAEHRELDYHNMDTIAACNFLVVGADLDVVEDCSIDFVSEIGRWEPTDTAVLPDQPEHLKDQSEILRSEAFQGEVAE